jgi:hypothetical protein
LGHFDGGQLGMQLKGEGFDATNPQAGCK